MGALSVVVAPHEYFPLHFLRTRPTIELEPTLASVAVLNVEQPGSEWFEVGWEFARLARHVFDISPAGVAEFHRRGVIGRPCATGLTPSLEAPALRPASDRPIDVLFLGHASPRRNAFFARHADFFSAFNCHIVVSEVDRPRLGHDAGLPVWRRAVAPGRLEPDLSCASTRRSVRTSSSIARCWRSPTGACSSPSRVSTPSP